MRQVIDTSVLLAYLFQEPGGNLLARDEGPFVLSSVNFAEALSKLIDRAVDHDEAMNALRGLPIEHKPFDREDARRAALLRTATRHRGLSLGDRACLALAQSLNLPVATADRQWAELDLGIAVRLTR
ncbi:MAG: type II toxin-antitoxin system VapC family toxin [Pseudomonadota bacterium]